MCGVPNGHESCGFIGKLGKLKDKACAVSKREMQWLDMIAQHLPKVTEQRVAPGEIDCVDGESPQLEKELTFRKVAPSFDFDGFFDHMYNEAKEHHQRKKALAAPVKLKEKAMTDPNLFNRLHRDHAISMANREKLREAGNAKRHHDANWAATDRKTRDPAVSARILAPRKPNLEPHFDCVAKREHLWALLNIQQLMSECDKLAVRIREVEPGFEWNSMGKSRCQLIRLLETRSFPNGICCEDCSVKSALLRDGNCQKCRELHPPMPEVLERLYQDHALKNEKRNRLQSEAVEAQKKSFLDGLTCPVHGNDFNIEKCALCRRFQALLDNTKCEAKASPKLWNNAVEVTKKKIEYRENIFKVMLKEGYYKVSLPAAQWNRPRLHLKISMPIKINAGSWSLAATKSVLSKRLWLNTQRRIRGSRSAI
jgi:hypothetical protein